MSKSRLGGTLQPSQITDPALYAAGRSHELWAEMRRTNPVMWVEPADGYEPFWAVTGYATGLEVLTNWATFASGHGTMIRPSMASPSPGAGSMLVLTDPPKHDAIRDAIAGLFTPQAVSRLEDIARELIVLRLSQVVGAGPFDFMTDVAEGLVLSISGAFLGIPAEDQGVTRALVKSVEATIRGASGDAGFADHLSLVDYFQGLLTRPIESESVLHRLLTLATDVESGVTMDDVVLTCDNILIAAGESTMQAAAGGLLALVEHPLQWEQICRGDASIKRTVQETLRWSSPAAHVLRTTTADTTLAGVKIPEGSPVSVWLPSMNRDEGEFSNGDRFEAGRWPNRHAAFGAGSHFCLGASLSRLILRVLFEEITAQSVAVTLEGEPQRLPSCYLNGFDRLPLALAPL